MFPRRASQFQSRTIHATGSARYNQSGTAGPRSSRQQVKQGSNFCNSSSHSKTTLATAAPRHDKGPVLSTCTQLTINCRCTGESCAGRSWHNKKLSCRGLLTLRKQRDTVRLARIAVSARKMHIILRKGTSGLHRLSDRRKSARVTSVSVIAALNLRDSTGQRLMISLDTVSTEYGRHICIACSVFA